VVVIAVGVTVEEAVAVAGVTVVGTAVVVRLRAVATVVVRAAVIVRLAAVMGMIVTRVPVAPVIVPLSGLPVQVASVVLLVVSVLVARMVAVAVLGVRFACHFLASISHSDLHTVYNQYIQYA
jgi:hypothetical protein